MESDDRSLSEGVYKRSELKVKSGKGRTSHYSKLHRSKNGIFSQMSTVLVTYDSNIGKSVTMIRQFVLYALTKNFLFRKIEFTGNRKICFLKTEYFLAGVLNYFFSIRLWCEKYVSSKKIVSRSLT